MTASSPRLAWWQDARVHSKGVSETGALAIGVFGFATLFGDAVSMGLGDFLSGRSERDLQNARNQQVRRPIAKKPDCQENGPAIGGAEDSAAQLRIAGRRREDAPTLDAIIRRNPALFSELVLAYGLDPPGSGHGNSRAPAWFTFVAFVVFGLVPVLPYLFLSPGPAAQAVAVTVTVAVTCLSLAGAGPVVLPRHRQDPGPLRR